jgi:hypothetical protein
MNKQETFEVWVDSGQVAFIPQYSGAKEGSGFAKPGNGIGLVKGLNNEYNSFVREVDSGSRGIRVSHFILQRDDLPKPVDVDFVGKVKIDNEEQALVISDPCYIHEGDRGGSGLYNDACNATYSTNTVKQAGIYSIDDKQVAACSSTGFGDGAYDCTITRDNDGKLESICVEFITEEDFDE